MKPIVKVAAIGVAVVFLVGLAFVVVPVWVFVVEPWWNARGLYAAADGARARPYVTAAEVRLDWLDGNRLTVYVDPDARIDDARRLWCEVLLEVDGRVQVYQGGSIAIPPPNDCPVLDVP